MADDVHLAAALAPWTLARAADRLLPKLVAELSSARDAAARVPSSTPGSWLRDGGEFLDRNDARRGAADAAFDRQRVALGTLIDHLRKLLESGEFQLYGRWGDLAAPLKPLGLDQVHGFADISIEQSILLLADRQTRVYGVHMVPAFASPDAPHNVSGWLVTIIDRHIWNGPEIRALCGDPLASELTDAIAAHGDNQLRLPLNGDADIIRKKLIALKPLAAIDVDEELAKAILAVAADRLDRLFDAMKSGALLAVGGEGGTGLELPIPLALWRSRSLTFCLVQGAVYGPGDRDQPLWRDVAIARRQGSGTARSPLDEDADEKREGNPGHREWDKALDDVLARRLFAQVSERPLFSNAADLEEHLADYAQQNALDIARGRENPDYPRNAKNFLRKYYPKTRWLFLPQKAREKATSSVWGDDPPN